MNHQASFWVEGFVFFVLVQGQAGWPVARTFPISTNTGKKRSKRTTRQEALRDQETEQAKGKGCPARQWTWKRRGQGLLTVMCRATRSGTASYNQDVE